MDPVATVEGQFSRVGDSQIPSCFSVHGEHARVWPGTPIGQSGPFDLGQRIRIATSAPPATSRIAHIYLTLLPNSACDEFGSKVRFHGRKSRL
jgi:hypothetical protein